MSVCHRQGGCSSEVVVKRGSTVCWSSNERKCMLGHVWCIVVYSISHINVSRGLFQEFVKREGGAKADG